MEWNEPLYQEGRGESGRVGVLLIHGFGGSPRSLQEMALRCVDAGYSVALPLLTGHGRTPEALEAAKWTEWTADVEGALGWLQARANRVFVCGLSMGGTLALWLTVRHPEVAGLITINALIRHPREKAMLVLGCVGIPRWSDPVGNDAMAPGVDERAYGRLPVRAARQLALLSRAVRASLDRIVCPVLVFSSAVDHVVPPQNQSELFAALASTDKEFVELADCYHLATMDQGRERVFAKTLDFIAGHAG
jgi:carboxylesterase